MPERRGDTTPIELSRSLYLLRCSIEVNARMSRWSWSVTRALNLKYDCALFNEYRFVTTENLSTRDCA